MRTAIRLALLGLLLLPATGAAQSPRDKVQIRAARVGFPPGTGAGDSEDINLGMRQTLYKPGAWAPIYVDVINAGKYDRARDGDAEVIVETLDCDDTAHNYVVPLPPFDPQSNTSSVITYSRPGSRFGDFTIRVVARGRDLCQPFKLGLGSSLNMGATGLEPAQGLYLALGSRLPGLKLGGPDPRQPNPNPNNAAARTVAAVIARVDELPPLWFGYAAADVAILSTSDRDFTTRLVGDSTRTAALAEWVRRGGRLIVCAGRNRDLINGSADLRALLPMDVGSSYVVPSLQVFWREGGGASPDPLGDGKTKLELTKLAPRDKPARGYRVLVEGPRDPAAGGSPLVAQGAYGLGAVTLTAFDLDQQPFIGWSGQAAFWEQLLARAGPRIPVNVGQPNVFRYNARGAPEGEADNQLQALNGQLETFEGVPVISFGWVALFILLYILLVGPLDYLFLKKVVKRLELTWITFPTIVLAVSAAAYFTAYHLKGSELRVNKVDLVDVDLQTQRAYGRAWFSVFSPRIQKYTVGVEPAAPAWTAPPDGGPPDAVMSWFGVPKQGRQSLFRHSYDYAPQAAGLRGVPIQVWTTKGFQANWQAALAKDKPPVENRLRHPPGRPDDLIGSVTSHLPAPLEDVLLIYKGEAAWLGTLLPDTPRTLSAQNRVKFSVWRDNPDAGAASAGAAARLPMNLLFHEAMQGRGEPNNAAFRDLDQSWRVNDENRDEVILVGRLAQVLADGKTVTRPDGSTETHPTAEEVNGGPRVPSRLWLGNLPLDGGSRPELRGSLRQDTIVRVFLPLQPEPRAGGVTPE